MSPETVAVLGCGPTGLIAAEAAAQLGAEVKVYSRKQPSVIGGAQYLHDVIPGFTGPSTPVQFVKRGTREEYARKVYGDPSAECSWDTFDGVVPAWSLRHTYDLLWDTWRDSIVDANVDQPLLDRICNTFDFVFSSIPLPVLAGDRREEFLWEAQTVYVVHRTGSFANNTIVYEGTTNEAWYRSSRLWSVGWTEYPEWVPQSVKVTKPLRTDCRQEDVWEDIIRIGRYGKWDKPVLAHHAWTDVTDALNAV